MTQAFSPVAVERKQEDVLAHALRLAAAIHASAALREAYLGPVGGAITAAVIPRSIHQGFQQHRLSVIGGQPIARQLPRRQREDMARQVWHFDPRQNQKAAVVYYQPQIGFCGPPVSTQEVRPM